VFSMWSVLRGYKRDVVQSVVNSQVAKRRLGRWCEIDASYLQECSIESPAVQRRIYV
jgi:hypothetical protein